MKKLILLLLVYCMTATSQNSLTTFDFWLGSWDAHWNDSLQGTNVVTKTMKGLVIEEDFSFKNGEFKGRSWSVFDTTTKMWSQTWVDDSGAYLLFTGGRQGDKVILDMTGPRKDKDRIFYMRMVFSDIKKESFTWDWQSSPDKIKWKSVWKISYRRK